MVVILLSSDFNCNEYFRDRPYYIATSNKVTVTAGRRNLNIEVEFANQSSCKDTRVQGISLIFLGQQMGNARNLAKLII